MKTVGTIRRCYRFARYNRRFVEWAIMLHGILKLEPLVFRDIGAAIAIVPFIVVAWFWPLLGDRLFTRIERWGRRISLRRTIAVLGTALLVVVLRFSVWPLMQTPVPHNHDEFSYLLAADTFTHARLASPTHPMWVYLETFHVNQFPMYMSKYPPAQGLVLALGQVVGHPWIGVLLSVACLCGAITWALQGWVPLRWAMLGGVLAATEFGAANYWTDSYMGGAVAGVGGSLVIGAFPRVLRSQRVRDALLLALGMGILANSRPYEGFILSLLIVAALAWRLFRNAKPGVRTALLRVALPIASVLVLTVGLIGYYNWRGTGNPMLMPYVVNDRAYKNSAFDWQKRRSQTYLNPQFDAFYSNPRTGEPSAGYSSMLSGILITMPDKLLKFQAFYFTLEMGIPFTIALFCLFNNKKVRFCLLVCTVGMAGMLVALWFNPHYAAPFTAVFFVLIVFGLRRLRVWQVDGKPVGLGLVRALVVSHVLLLLASVAAQVLVLQRSHDPWDRGQARARIQAQFESMPGQHLVLVRYAADHNPNQEWVYNGAEIDHAKVVWAREIPGRSNQPLLDYFRGRTFWLLEADVNPAQLRPLPKLPHT